MHLPGMYVLSESYLLGGLKLFLVWLWSWFVSFYEGYVCAQLRIFISGLCNVLSRFHAKDKAVSRFVNGKLVKETVSYFCTYVYK